MARPIMVSREGVVSSFQLDRVERRSLYGIRRRVPVDASGEPCSRAALTDDGTVLLRSGMTAQGWFLADGRQVESDAIGAQDDDGQPLELVPSTLGEPQELEGPTDYSPDRKTPLERTLRAARTQAEAEAIGDALIAENIKKGWQEVVAASAPAPPAPTESAAAKDPAPAPGTRKRRAASRAKAASPGTADQKASAPAAASTDPAPPKTRKSRKTQ